jgi:membrane associated rhomboid family serine protease
VDRKGRRHPCSDEQALAAAIVDDAGARVDMVWTPASPNLVLPEEVPSLWPALKSARLKWAEWEMEEGLRQMKIFGIFMIGFAVISALGRGGASVLGTLGLALILFLVLGFFPWYQGRKRWKRAKAWAADEAEPDLDGLRFEVWLMSQKTPITLALGVLLGIVALAQWLGPLSLSQQLAEVGLTKEAGRATDWWRLGTAAFLHGHPLHFIFNLSALLYLGRRMEVLVRWPHVLIVFALSAWVGNECSARWLPAPSLGASGGLLGMLGFLLVFEWMHRRLVPESSRRRLMAGLLTTALIGLVGFRFVDNAAHAGGTVAGMIYAFAMFPRSSAATRPRMSMVDLGAGMMAAAAILVFAGWAMGKLLA